MSSQPSAPAASGLGQRVVNIAMTNASMAVALRVRNCARNTVTPAMQTTVSESTINQALIDIVPPRYWTWNRTKKSPRTGLEPTDHFSPACAMTKVAR